MVGDRELNPDHSRGMRLGCDETAFCGGKSSDQIRRILQGAVDNGYGVGANGIAALHNALASLAPGLPAINVDNGYGAGCAALDVVLNAIRTG